MQMLQKLRKQLRWKVRCTKGFLYFNLGGLGGLQDILRDRNSFI